MEQNRDIFEIDIIKLLQLFLSKWYLILLCVLLGGAAGFGYSNYFIDPTYQSKALMYVNSSISISKAISVNASDLSTSARVIDTYNVILKTRNCLDAVAKKANLNYSFEKLNNMISSSSVNGTEVFQIVVTSNNPEEACLIANTIVEVFPDKIANVVNGSSAKIVDYAVVNANKIGPNVSRYTLIGAFIGALLCCGILFLLYILDDTIRGEDYLTSTYETPVLAVIPNLLFDKNAIKKYKKMDSSKYYYAQKSDKSGNNNKNTITTQLADLMKFDAKEAYKLLRTNLQFTLPNNGECKVIALTSAIRGEGKSTTSINLAHTLAQGNHKVLLIEADMRLPSISAKLNIKNKVGLSDYIIGNATAKDVIIKYKDSEFFHIMLGGSIPPNPSELLGSEAMKEVINRFKSYYDFIILDLPPVNIVTDALVTRDYVDGMIVTVRENYSDKRALSECLRSLELIEANLLGFVLTDSKGGKSYYSSSNRYNYRYRYRKYGYSKYGYNKYGYGYDYGYGYGRPNKDVTKEKVDA